MQYTVPHYYKKFRCLAGACPDTCCAGWQIQIDPASLNRYASARGPLGSRLKNEIVWSKKHFRQYDGRCAFLNDDNLCDLYLEGGGGKAFCRTCRTYPRHIEEFEGLREISLSLSCPAAARLILESPEKVRFLHAENPNRSETYPEFDFLLFTKLMDARTLAIEILQNREHSIKIRMAAVLSLAHDLQTRIDRNALFDADSLFARYSSPRLWTWFAEKLESADGLRRRNGNTELRKQTLGSLFVILNQMEVLRPEWKDLLRKARTVLQEKEEDTHSPLLPPDDAKQEETFRQIFSDITVEQLMVYFVFTYFCGAVYNQNAYGKMKFSFAAVVLIRELTRAQWLSESRTELCADRLRLLLLQTACRYAREIEHSDFNKCKMEKLLENEEKFGLENLFSLL